MFVAVAAEQVCAHLAGGAVGPPLGAGAPAQEVLRERLPVYLQAVCEMTVVDAIAYRVMLGAWVISRWRRSVLQHDGDNPRTQAMIDDASWSRLKTFEGFAAVSEDELGCEPAELFTALIALPNAAHCSMNVSGRCAALGVSDMHYCVNRVLPCRNSYIHKWWHEVRREHSQNIQALASEYCLWFKDQKWSVEIASPRAQLKVSRLL